MAREKTYPTQVRLTAGEKEAVQKLALAGWVIDPDDFNNRTQVGVIRKTIRDAWKECPETKNRPFPGEE